MIPVPVHTGMPPEVRQRYCRMVEAYNAASEFRFRNPQNGLPLEALVDWHRDIVCFAQEWTS